MNQIISFLGSILGWLMYFSYKILHNYFWSIVFFTFLTKIVLLPVSLMVQKNSIKMVKMQPEINFIKAKYFGNNDKISEEQYELYKREHYKPLADLIPLMLQLILLMGVIDVINYPEMHIFRGQAGTLDTMLGSLDLSAVPAQTGGIAYIVPLIAALSAWFMCFIQNKINVLQSEQSKLNQYGTMLLSIALSLYLGFFVKTGVGLYWAFSNLFSVVQLYFLNKIMDPKKYIDYEALEQSRKELREASQFQKAQKKLFAKDPYRKKERADYKRFFKDYDMQLVFYSEKNGFYKYYQNIIETLLEKSDVIINYITSDPEDKVFEMASDRFRPFYIGEHKLIVLMMKMEADIVVMTTPDLESFHIKRSLVRKDNEYIYVPHDVNSPNLTFRKEALDHFDTIFSSGFLCTKEIRKREELYQLPKKKVIEWGSSVIDNMIAAFEKIDIGQAGEEKKILIAPSWQKDNILYSCIEEILEGLDGHGYHIIIRPHPQFVRHEEGRIARLQEKCHEGKEGKLELQTDFSSNRTVYEADLVITDWSSIAFEYAFATCKPVLFINTPMKIMNEDYEELGITPIDIELRDKVGKSLDLNQIGSIAAVVEELLNSSEFSKEALQKIRDTYIYHIGESGKIGADYIMERLKYFEKLHEEED